MTEGLLAKREGWEEQAHCKDLDPDTFFRKEDEDIARAICSKCEVQEQCLNFALKHGIQYGIWGGLNEQERKALRRRLRRKASA